MPSSNSGEAEKSQVGPHGDGELSPGEMPARSTVVKKDVVERADQAVARDDLVAAHTDTQAQTQVSDTQIKTPGSKIDNSVDPVVASGAGVAAHTGTQVQSQVGDTQTKTTVSKIDNSVDPAVARDDDVAVCDGAQAKAQVGLIDKTVLELKTSDDQRSSVDTGLNSTTNTSDLTKNFQNVTLGPNMPSVQDMAQSKMLEPTVVQTTNNVQNDTSDPPVGQRENNGQNKTLEPMEITISEDNNVIDDEEERDSQSGNAESTDSDCDELENTDQQRDNLMNETSAASVKKRKRRTRKKDYVNKREKRREKLAGKKVDDKTTQSFVLNEKTSIQNHEWLDTSSRHQQDGKADNSKSQSQSDSQVISHPLDNNNSSNVDIGGYGGKVFGGVAGSNTLHVDTGGYGGKVFGGFTDSKTAATSADKVRDPPLDYKSLFEVDTKSKATKGATGNADDKMSKLDSKTGEIIDSAHESTKKENENLKTTVKGNKTGNGSKGQQPGVTTRNQTKNSQKTAGSDEKNKKV